MSVSVTPRIAAIRHGAIALPAWFWRTQMTASGVMVRLPAAEAEAAAQRP